MRNKAKKIFFCIIGLILVLVLMLGATVMMMFGTFITAAQSVRKLEDGLYCMEYHGDYGFDRFLEEGGADSDEAVADYLVQFLSHGFYKGNSQVQTGKYGCSTIVTEDDDGGYIFGRNYDWEKCRGMIVHTRPTDGYESFSTCCLDFLGFGDAYEPDGSLPERFQTLAAIYVPLDGMNEKGLMVADLVAGDDEATHQKRGKVNLTTTTAIRLLLDRAADVDEALALLDKYDMNSSIDSAHHFAIADASGRSVVVEYVNGEMLVADTKVVTNHYICDSSKKDVGSEQSHLRFDTLMKHSGKTDMAGVRDLLASVAQNKYPQSEGSYEKTMWSIVYNPGALTANFYFDENYEHDYGIILLEKGSFIKR